jgi:hypoxanthine phosphoribosyltransferase
MTIVAIAPLTIVLIIVLGFFYRKDEVFDIARALQNKRAFEPPVPITSPAPLPQLPDDLEVLDRPRLIAAIEELSEYAKSARPDWIVGVHPGGRLLSVYIANRINFPPERCLFVRTSANRSRSIVFEPQRSQLNRPIAGKMLAIDDISRTGQTLLTLKRFFISQNYRETEADDPEFKLKIVRFAIMLIVAQPEKTGWKFRPDHVCYRTNERYFRLPWSKLSSEIEVAFASRRQEMDFDGNVITAYERIAKDYDYALEVAQRYMEDDSITGHGMAALMQRKIGAFQK